MKPHLSSQGVELYHGDCLAVLPELAADSVQCCVTSPPYFGLRDYNTDGQLGLERTPGEYVTRIVEVFREVMRVLRDDGTLWLNLGDSYAAQGGRHNGRTDNQQGVGAKRVHLAGGGDQGTRTPPRGLKRKNLIGIPWRVAFALQADGWYLRSDIIWHKPNPIPESVTDRPTKSHEYVFLLTKSAEYYYDADAISEPCERPPDDRGSRADSRRDVEGANRIRAISSTARTTRNRRTVWTIPTHNYPGSHFATFPPKLVEPCIVAGCREGDTVLDPFAGSGTTGEVAVKNGCHFVGVELNREYLALAAARFRQRVLF